MSTHTQKSGLRELRVEGPHSLIRHEDLYSREALFHLSNKLFLHQRPQ